MEDNRQRDDGQKFPGAQKPPSWEPVSRAEEDRLIRKGAREGALLGVLLVLPLGLLAFWLFWVYLSGQNAQTSLSSAEEKRALLEKLIEEHYYQEEDIDARALEDGMYRGMVQALQDPYSEYFTPEDLEKLFNQREGIYYGIGAYVNQDQETGLVRIAGLIPESPAEEEGLQENDLIFAVNGEEIQGKELQEVISLITGPENTEVSLTIVREGAGELMDFRLTRRKVERRTVDWEMKDQGIAHIVLREFDTVTEEQFAEALSMAKESGMKALVLDLRGNMGGNLSTVLEIARMMLPEGLIAYTEDKNGVREEFFCDGKQQLDIPMAVLINGNSASASELLAGALRDYEMAVLVGTTSFGKGIVQETFPLSDGSALKLTVSHYFSPKGVGIHGVGIAPDVEIAFDREAYIGPEKKDNQLDKALEILSGELAK